ncbi:hypothetical protein LguiA_007579 [Lonicera macranthoides]
MRFPPEKLGGGRCTKSMREFDNFIKEAELRDIAMYNLDFTWSNMRERLACSRLNRFLFTSGWEDSVQLVRQEALVRATSDHCPIILDTNCFKWGPTPFRFENMWLRNKEFCGKFKEWWESSVHQGWEGYKFMMKLGDVKREVRKWNKEVFGDIRIEKFAILRRIEELDKIDYSSRLNEDERLERGALRRKLEELLVKEEVSWHQKAKVKGVIEWDNNSKLFHRVASGRKVNNIINKLENVSGEVFQTEREIEREILNYFENLYKDVKGRSFGIDDLDWARVEAQSMEMLERPFEEREVKEALFLCDGQCSKNRDFLPINRPKIGNRDLPDSISMNRLGKSARSKIGRKSDQNRLKIGKRRRRRSRETEKKRRRSGK